MNNKKAPEISKQEFTNLVEQGKTKEELAIHYNLTKANISEIADQLNIKFKRKIQPKFILIDDLDKPIKEEESLEEYFVFEPEKDTFGL